MKRTYALMLAAVLAVSSVSGCSDNTVNYTTNTTDISAAKGSWAEYFAAPTVDESMFSYKTNRDGTVIITDYLGNDCAFDIPAPEGDKIPDDVYEQYVKEIENLQPLKVPAEINGAKVDEVDFSASTAVMPVVILPDTITSVALNSSTEKFNIPAGYETASAANITIGNTAIKHYKATSAGSALTEVYIPEGVAEIGDYAFNGCKNLKTAKLPASVTSIGYGAFRGCEKLVNIDVSGVTEISDWAFSGCKNLLDVSFNEALPAIGAGAFNNTGLSEVAIPAGVKTIGDGAFNDCEYLTAINVNEGNNAYVSSNGILFAKDMKTLIKYPNAKADAAYEIPAGVKTIDDNAFSANPFLSSVVVPKGVNTIGFGAFEGCKELASIALPSSVNRCEWNASDVFANAFDNLSPSIWITYGSKGFDKAGIENNSVYYAINHLIDT